MPPISHAAIGGNTYAILTQSERHRGWEDPTNSRAGVGLQSCAIIRRRGCLSIHRQHEDSEMLRAVLRRSGSACCRNDCVCGDCGDKMCGDGFQRDVGNFSIALTFKSTVTGLLSILMSTRTRSIPRRLRSKIASYPAKGPPTIRTRSPLLYGQRRRS